MARFYPALEARHRDFIAAQKLFFTASGTGDSRINLSPKGMDSLRVLSDSRVAYLDLTGSGNETAAHLKHDGRMTMMWCSFDADPLILRLYGHGHVVRRQDAAWAELHPHFAALPGERQIIVLDIDAVQTSCGYAVPTYTYIGERDTLARWAEKKGAVGLLDYWREKNQVSIDGLPTDLLEDTP
ncbi:MAG: pyridoxamine 5'-phosphate oxidase family protein [Thiobacillus sp.]|nr:pyridoxamine 5'-phosphate oxidase family protein [Thiobacillus sp.]